MSNQKANTCEIVLGVSALEYTRQPTASNTTEFISKVSIDQVVARKVITKPVSAAPSEWGYRFDTIVEVDVLLRDGNHFLFALQEVTNQPTWTATLAGQKQCVADINAWL